MSRRVVFLNRDISRGITPDEARRFQRGTTRQIRFETNFCFAIAVPSTLSFLSLSSSSFLSPHVECNRRNCVITTRRALWSRSVLSRVDIVCPSKSSPPPLLSVNRVLIGIRYSYSSFPMMDGYRSVSPLLAIFRFVEFVFDKENRRGKSKEKRGRR